MPDDLHRRLKIVSIQQRIAVTDIMNQAVRQWLERYDDGAMSIGGGDEASIPSKTSALRQSKNGGNFHDSAAGIAKLRLVLIAKHLGIEANGRWSRDRLLSAIHEAL